MFRARKYRFASCFRVLSNQYVERSAYANVFKSNRENESFERGKLNSRCFHWFPAAMLEPLRRASTWRLHTKHYNIQWYLLPNNSSSEYRTSPKPWQVVYLLLLDDFQFLDPIYQMVKRFYFFTCVIIKLTCVTWKPRIQCKKSAAFCLRWLPRVTVKHPPYRARVRKGNIVNSSYSFPRSDLPEWILLK